jgi:hypothetical protein
MASSWFLHSNGSFDICSGPLLLEHAYPSLDGEPIHSVRVAVKRSEDGGVITYQFVHGKLKLTLGRDSDGLVLNAALSDLSAPLHWVYPVAFARVTGADRWYKQGLGFGGPSGVLPLAAGSPVWSLDSHTVAGFIAPNDWTMVVGACEHRTYLQRSTVYTRQHRRGLVDRHVDSEEALFEAGFAVERTMPENGRIKLPTLHFVDGERAFDTFRRFARKLGASCGARLDKPASYHWCSWYEYESRFSLSKLEDQLAGFRRIQPALPLQTIQIDDGYCEHGDWLSPNERWPGGLETAFRMVCDAGYRAGIWIGPFMVSSNSRLYREHPDWVLKGPDGTPIVEWRRPEGDHCHLDTSHPEAFEYLREVFRAFRSWGAGFFKTDFMDWGLKDSVLCNRYRPGKTSVQYYCDVVRMIRETIGKDSYWLGCISPFGQMVGLVDGMRVSNDVGAAWSEGGLGNMLQESAAGQYFNNVWWQNDNDTLYLRGVGCQPHGEVDAEASVSTLSAEELKSLALWDGVTGGVVNTSDRLHRVSADNLRLFRFLEPPTQRHTAALPYWSGHKRLRVAVRAHAGERSWAVLALNPLAEPVTEELPLAELTGHGQAFCFQWDVGASRSLGACSTLSPTLAPHASALYYVSTDDKAPAEDLGLCGIHIPGLAP